MINFVWSDFVIFVVMVLKIKVMILILVVLILIDLAVILFLWIERVEWLIGLCKKFKVVIVVIMIKK